MKTCKVLFVVVLVASAAAVGGQTPPQKKVPPPGITAARANLQIPTTVVPSLTGMSLDKATSILHDRHLNLGTVSNVQSDRPKGTVVSQSPESDNTVAWGTKVDIGLAVPIEVRRTPVPNVVGRDLRAAQAVLEKFQLRAGPEIPRPSNEPAGQVIAQSIKPETVVPIGTSVGLAFAEQITVLVPNLVGRTVDEASNLLAKGQLGLGETGFVEQDGPAGMVIAQDIPEGSPVPIGTRIGLKISQTPTPVDVAVPNVVGKSRDEAVKILTQAGFQAGSVRGEVSTQPADVVLSQSPTAGTLLLPNNPIDLVTAVTLFTVPGVVGLTHADAFRAIEDAHFSQGAVTTRLSIFSSEGNVLEQKPSAGNQFIAAQAVDLIVAKNLPPWIPLPLVLLSAGSIGALVYRRAIPRPPQTPSVMAVRANVEMDRGATEIHADNSPGSDVDIVVRTRVDYGTFSVREDARKEMQ